MGMLTFFFFVFGLPSAASALAAGSDGITTLLMT